MKTTVNQPSALILTFTWIGFVCAISFMEAWLKFRAPGVTLQIGLGIGRLVFNALNKVEWLFIISIFISIIRNWSSLEIKQKIIFFIVFIILTTQTFWLLPTLDKRAELHISSLSVTDSNMHIYFVLIEGLKVILLFVFGISLIKNTQKN